MALVLLWSIWSALMKHFRKLTNDLPDSPGVYTMKGERGRILYIGKAGNLRRRVSSYFLRANNARIERLVSEIKKIEHKKTDSALEALLLEAALIKKHQPPYNIREKDDKSFLFVEITKEKFPRVLLARGKNPSKNIRFGPFASASNIREGLKIIRKLFPWSVHLPEKIKKPSARSCFDVEIGLCPGVCAGLISRANYLKNIRRIKLFLKGRKKAIIRELEKEMALASEKLDFENAGKIKRKIIALRHIQDAALINDPKTEIGGVEKETPRRIEGYDVSNISGDFAVGVMVVFMGGEPDKSQYRKFKIKTVFQPNDVAMLKEVLSRRLNHKEWSLPELILIDGGKGQVGAAEQALAEAGLKIKLLGIAKGPERKRNDISGIIPKWTNLKTLIKVRDESHRFAIGYHKKLRNRIS